MPDAQNGPHELADEKLITRRQLQQFLPISTTTIWRLEKSGGFPKHVTIRGPKFLACERGPRIPEPGDMNTPDTRKLPWMKFYPADWRADPALRMCSLAARGLWMEMLSIMHEADPRGSLLINGKPIGTKQLASLCGATLRETTAFLNELDAAGVFSRAEDGTIFSRRMKRDDEKAARDKANGKAGGNPNLNAGVNTPDKAQSPEARSQSPESRIYKESKERTRARALAALGPKLIANGFGRHFQTRLAKPTP